MNPFSTIDEIQTATGLGERAVRAWIRRLDIVPAAVSGRTHQYPSSTVAAIQAAQIKRSLARRRSRAVDGDSVADEAADLAAGVITVQEAKLRAKGGR